MLGKLLFGAANGMFYALDARSGQQLAHTKLGGSVVAPPALGAGLIFVRAEQKRRGACILTGRTALREPRST